MSAPALDRLQRRFWRLITAPQGVAAGLPAVAAEDGGAAPLSRWIAGDEEQALQRLDVYANMYFYRLLDSLRADFPACVALCGDAPFHNLVTDYLLAHPPDDASLRSLGRALPAYLRGHVLSSKRPELPDLARLEWARIEAFDAADATPLGAELLAALPTEEWPALQLLPTPALRLIDARFPVHERWEEAMEGEVGPGAPPAATRLAVWRKGFVVRHRAIEEDEGHALQQIIGGGLRFDALCELLADEQEAVEASAQRAASLLARWVAAEMLARP